MDQYSYDRRSGGGPRGWSGDGGPRGGGRQVMERGGTRTNESASRSAAKKEGELPALDVRESAVLERAVAARAEYIVRLAEGGNFESAKAEFAKRAGIDAASVSPEDAKNYFYTKAVNDAIVGLANANGIKLNPQGDTWKTAEAIVKQLQISEGKVDAQQLSRALTAAVMQRDYQPWKTVKEFELSGLSYDQETKLAKKVNSEYEKAKGDMQNASNQADMKARRAMEERINGQTGVLPVGADFMEERYRELWAKEIKNAEKAMNKARANGMRQDNIRSVSKEEIEARARDHWKLVKELTAQEALVAARDARAKEQQKAFDENLNIKFLEKSGLSPENVAEYKKRKPEERLAFVVGKLTATDPKITTDNYAKEFDKFKANLPISERTAQPVATTKEEIQRYGNMSWSELKAELARENVTINPTSIIDAETRRLIGLRVIAENQADREVKGEKALSGRGLWNYAGIIAGGVRVGSRGTSWRLGGTVGFGNRGYGYGGGGYGYGRGSTGWGYNDWAMGRGFYGLGW